MSLLSSQILSNFKLFSKTDNANSLSTVSLGNISTQHKLIFAFVTLVVFVFIYFTRKEFLSVASVVGGSVDLSDIIGKWWVNSHLTSTGELATTYVPKEFLEI